MEEQTGKGRIIIYGAGAIGSALGGHLFLSGVDVVLIGRPGHINLIRRQGLKFITPAGIQMLKMEGVTAPGEIIFRPEDIVFLCMKSQDTEPAVQELRKIVRDVPVFCFQNGIRNEEIVSGYFPRVYGVMVRIGGEFLQDGEVTVRRDPPGWAVIGRYPAGTDGLAESVASLLRKAGFSVLVSPDVMPYKWGKLVVNLNNAVGAITGANWEETRDISRAVMAEALEILKESGVHWKSQEKLAEEWPEFNVKPHKVLPTTEQSSTWQSLTRRRGTVETDFLNGEIVRLARSIGKEAPVNAALVRLSREMAAKRELPGKYSPAELSRMLGLG